MSDLTPSDPELRDRLAAIDPPEHGPDFWRGLDDRVDLVRALRDCETPEHLDGFWAAFDARLHAEPDRDQPVADVVALRTTVFEDAPAPAARARPTSRLTRRRLQRLVQISAAAAIVAVLAGAASWWATRDDAADQVAVPFGSESTTTTTTIAPPTTTAPPRVIDVKPTMKGTVPIGASPDGKYLYVAVPAPPTERCAPGSSTDPFSTAAMWLYAEPVDGSASHRILTDRIFAEPRMTLGPSEKVVVSDSCSGSTRHVIASAEPNGALSVDRVVLSGPSTPLAVDGAAWSASGTGLFLRGAGSSGWYRYDLANASLDEVPEIAATAQVVEQLANEQFVSVTRRTGASTWAVSVGGREIVAINAPSHGDYSRAVRVDPRHGQLAIAGKDTLVVLTARPAGEVGVGTYRYAAEAITWAADGNGLVAAPRAGGLEYLSFTPAAENPATVALAGFDGVAYSLLAVPTSSSLVVRQGVSEGGQIVAGEALLLELTA